MSDTTEENWPTPGQQTASVLNPAGPFRPIRRWLVYLFGATVVGSILAAVLGAGGLAILLASGLGTVGLVWLALWFLDTILAYLKG